MRKTTLFFQSLALIFVFLFSFNTTSAQSSSATFNVSLNYGSSLKQEVLKLQNFLINLGYLNTSATGLYLSMTQKAVVDFQKAEGIVPASGYFGPLTRAVANNKLVVTDSEVKASISTVLVMNPGNAATALLSNYKTVTWKTANYPKNVGVNINLLRKVSESPQAFVLIRNIANNTLNDGSETWIPENIEKGDDVYIEITCSNTYSFKNGCELSNNLAKVN